jgi:hypothetical protein
MLDTANHAYNPNISSALLLSQHSTYYIKSDLVVLKLDAS